jgi:seryl-tRNA synthetase
MLDFHHLAARLPYFLQNCKNRQVNASPIQVLQLWTRYKQQLSQIEGFKIHRDQLAASEPVLLQETERLAKSSRYNGANLAQEQLQLKRIEVMLAKEARKLPNTTHLEVPTHEAKVIQQAALPLLRAVKGFPKIAEELELCRPSPSGPQWTGRGVFLERGLVSYGLDFMRKQGFQVLSLPSLVPRDFAAQLDDSPQTSLQGHKMVLASSAEMALLSEVNPALCPVVSGGTGSPEQVSKLCGASVCFPSSAQGVFTQSTQLGAVVLCEAQASDALHQQISSCQEAFLTSLQVPYRILDSPAKDLTQAAHRTFAVQVWLPSQEVWVDAGYSSNCTDFIARRLNWTKAYIHTVQASLLHSASLTSILIELWHKQGGLEVPEALKSYLEM